MKLIWFTVNGYKRFASKTKMNVDGKVVAIVGPNEAGKSSFLKALLHLNHPNGFSKAGSNQELTRGVAIEPAQQIIEAGFLLEDSDIQAIAHLHGGQNTRWMTVSKLAEGNIIYASLSPNPHRDRQPRQNLVETLQQVMATNPNLPREVGDAVVDLLDVIDVDDETLDATIISKIRNFAAMLEDIDSSELSAIQTLPEELNALASHEESDSPEKIARNIIFRRRPKVLFFSDQARNLQSSYTLDQQIINNVPEALGNLARLAKLDLRQLLEVISQNDQGQIDDLIERANAELKVIIKQAWSQAEISIRLKQDGPVLYVMVKDVGAPVDIAERSDGLRQFIALLAFVSLENVDQPPILLIDEAETHLHYDAQADLVQMFAKQDIASKVIYTTHSIGCLPEDLGTGVRMINPDLASGTSEIKDHFWANEIPGISPLLFGMGAKTLAFIATRAALITEGATEHLLLPTILREATGREYLGFQVIPGLSEADGNGIGILERESPCTAYFADSDGGGNAIVKKLKKAKIPLERIHQLPQINNCPSELEDYLSPEIYVEAVNEELRRSFGDKDLFSIGDLPETGRPTAFKNWCKLKGLSPPNKGAIAYRVLELRNEFPILAESQREVLKQLYDKICSSFKSTA